MARNPATEESPILKADARVELETVRAELQRVLQSPTFADSGRLRKLLQFLVEETICGRGALLKEYLVGVEVFGRPESFDPRNDSIVRVQARNLRKLLDAHYAGEGQHAQVRISIPKGSYTPVFAYAPVNGRRRLAKAFVAVAALLVLGLGAWAGTHLYHSSGTASIAVLPFANLSGEPRNDYLAEAVSEDLTTELAKIPRLHVVARTSASRFRGGSIDAREVGRLLRVGALLEGSLRRSGDSVHVTAQLIGAGDGFHIWSESYERPVSALPSIQADIVASVARALRVEPRVSLPLEWRRGHTVNPEANDIYLRGRYKRYQRRFGDLRAGIECFERATRIDPQFAEAHAALAAAYALVAFHDQSSAESAARSARTSADRALALNDGLAGAHMVKAQLAYFRDWDWATSDREFQRAFELNPSYAAAHQGRALSLLARARFQEAIADSRRALELDPLSYTVSNDLGTILYAAGRADEATRRCREILALAPDFKPPRLLLGAIDASRGNYRAAIAEYEAQRPSGAFGSELLGRLGYAYSADGRRADALALLKQMEAQPENERVYAHLAMLHAGLGNKRQALECLEKSAQRRETDVIFIAVEPHYSTLKDEPAFQALRKRIGI